MTAFFLIFVWLRVVMDDLAVYLSVDSVDAINNIFSLDRAADAAQEGHVRQPS